MKQRKICLLFKVKCIFETFHCAYFGKFPFRYLHEFIPFFSHFCIATKTNVSLSHWGNFFPSARSWEMMKPAKKILTKAQRTVSFRNFRRDLLPRFQLVLSHFSASPRLYFSSQLHWKLFSIKWKSTEIPEEDYNIFDAETDSN